MKKRLNGYWKFNTILQAAQTCSTVGEFYKKFPGATAAAQDLKIKDQIYELANLLHRYVIKGTWTNLENLKKEALKYKHRSDFENGSSGAYDAARRMGCMDEICQHMIPQANILNRALYAFEFSDKSVYIGLTWNYKQRYANHKNNPFLNEKRKSYTEKFVQYNEFFPYKIAAVKEGELIQCYKNNGWEILNRANAGALGASRAYWTFDRCLAEVKKYKTKQEFRRASKSCYIIMCRNNWKDEIYKKLLDF